MTITLRNILDLLDNSDMIRIVRDKEELICGYKRVILYEHEMGEINTKITALLQEKVVKFKVCPEVRHKEWEKRGLMEPIHPENAPDYKFSDLQITLYYTIILQGKEKRDEDQKNELENRIRHESAKCATCPDFGIEGSCEGCPTWGNIQACKRELETIRNKNKPE